MCGCQSFLFEAEQKYRHYVDKNKISLKCEGLIDDIDSGDGSVPLNSKSLYELMLTKIYDAIWWWWTTMS